MSLSKAAALLGLGLVAAAITVSGLWFTTVSITLNNEVTVLGNPVPAYLLGFAAIYLGVTSFIKLFRLARALKNPKATFSWKNLYEKKAAV